MGIFSIFKTFARVGGLILGLAFLPIQLASANFTNGLFVGGCPNATDAACSPPGNDSEALVAAVLGIDVSLVDFVERNDPPGPGTNISTTGAGSNTGTWSVTSLDTINYIVLKTSNWFTIFELSATSGDWMTDATTWASAGGGVGDVICPMTICVDARPYSADDFLTGGGTVSNISHITGYKVVPIPAAVWLFGSALLGLVSVGRRKKQLLV